MTASANTRLLDLLSPDKDSSWFHYETKLKSLALSEADYELACSALEQGNFVLGRLVSDALWDEELTRMKVMIRTFGFFETFIQHEINHDQYPSKKINETYKGLVLGKASEKATDAGIERLASQLKAEFLTSALYLATGSSIVMTRMDIVEFIKFPLVRNEAAVEKALPVILDIWFMSNTGELDVRPKHNDLFDIAELVSERPEDGALIAELTRSRKSYDGAVIREMLNGASKALVTGTL